MIRLSFEKLAAIVNGTLTNSDSVNNSFKGVSIDSRTVNDGELFIAIRGERSDGHDYLAAASQAGAAGVLIELDPEGAKGVPGDRAIISVPDTHAAMTALAKYYRDQVNPTVVGITGSNGKTTTKELTYHLLHAANQHVYRTPGNLNNLFGLPLSIFRMPESTKVAVFEMGISVPGEMARLTALAQPDIAVLINIGRSHLEYLKSVEDVARAKFEMVTTSGKKQQVIINADDPVLVKEAKTLGLKPLTFGIDSEADVRPDDISTYDDGTTRIVVAGKNFRLPLPGRHQVYNLLAAHAVSQALGFSYDTIDTEAISFTTAAWRGQLVERNGVRFLADCYNANPESVKAGLRAFFDMPWSGRRIVVLGDMLELGKDAPRYHQQIGGLMGQYTFNQLFLVGPLSNHIQFGAINSGVEEARCRHFKKAADLAAVADRLFESGDFVYVKASRGIGLEVVLNAFLDKEEAA